MCFLNAVFIMWFWCMTERNRAVKALLKHCCIHSCSFTPSTCVFCTLCLDSCSLSSSHQHAEIKSATREMSLKGDSQSQWIYCVCILRWPLFSLGVCIVPGGCWSPSGLLDSITLIFAKNNTPSLCSMAILLACLGTKSWPFERYCQKTSEATSEW